MDLRQLSMHDQAVIPTIEALVWEYFEWGNIELKKHYGYDLNIKDMMDTFLSELPLYCQDDTRLYLVCLQDKIVGLGSFKKKSPGIVELKRVYLQEPYRGKGYGRKLLSQLLEDARTLGHKKMFLESAGFMQSAYALYVEYGFQKIQNYTGIETPPEFAGNIYCMELDLVAVKSSDDNDFVDPFSTEWFKSTKKDNQ